MKKYIKREKLLLVVIIVLFGLFCWDFLREKKIQIKYIEDSVAKYVIYLNDDTYFKDDFNNKYLSNTIENIRVNFNYKAYFNRKLNYSGVYYLKAKISTFDSNSKLLNMSESRLTDKIKFKSEKNKVTFSKDAVIDYQEYFKYAEVFRNNFSSSDKVLMELVLCIDDGDSERELSSLKIPLNDGLIDFTVNNINTGQGNVYSYCSHCFSVFNVFLLILEVILVRYFIVLYKKSFNSTEII